MIIKVGKPYNKQKDSRVRILLIATLSASVIATPTGLGATPAAANIHMQKQVQVERSPIPIAADTANRSRISNVTCTQLINKLKQYNKASGKSESTGVCIDEIKSITPSKRELEKLNRTLRERASEKGLAAAASVPQYPDLCFRIPNPSIGFYYTRNQACRAGGSVRPNILRVDSNGTVRIIGSFRLRFWEAALIATVPGNSKWQQFATGTVDLVSGDTAGVTMEGVPTCKGVGTIGSNCRVALVTGGSFPPQDVSTINKVAEGGFLFESLATAPGVAESSLSEIKYKFAKPGAASFEADYLIGNPPQIRCDNKLPGNIGSGCVFEQYKPVHFIGLNGTAPLYAAHVRDALASGLPGGYNSATYPNGSPLRRLTDNDLKRKNGDRACPSKYPRPQQPVVHECDEYPYRSTWQGAYTANPGYPADPTQPWPARTHDWCQIYTEPQGVTGSNGYSVCMVPGSENGTGGNNLLSFYNSNRIIENDPFYVSVK